MAEERLVQIGIISASNLKDVNYISKMETYAVLTFAPYVEYTTQVDSKGGLNPRWDEKLGFLVPEHVLSKGEAHLKVEIFTLSTLGPKFVSEVDIPLADLTVSTQFKEPVLKRYPLKTNSGDYHGDLHVSFSLGEKVVLKKGEHPQYPIVTRFSPQASGPLQTPSTAPPPYSIPATRPSQVRLNGGPLPATTKPPPGAYANGQPLPTSYTDGLHSTGVPHRRPATPPSSVFESPPSSPFSPLSSRPKPATAFDPSLPLVVRDGDNTYPPSYASPLSTKPVKPPPQPISAPSGFTKQSPYGPPYTEGESATYHPIKPPPKASPKFGSHGYTDPISRSDESITPFDRSGYGYGDDNATGGPKYGTSRTSVPITNGYGYGDDYAMGGPKYGTSRTSVPVTGGYGYGDDYAMGGPKSGTTRANVPVTTIVEETARFHPFEQGNHGGVTKYGYQAPAVTDTNHVFGSPIGKLLLTELTKTSVYERRY